MNAALKTCFRPARDGEILAHAATFLPVEPAGSGDFSPLFQSEGQHFTGFGPVFNINRKNLTVAHSLLMEVLR